MRRARLYEFLCWLYGLESDWRRYRRMISAVERWLIDDPVSQPYFNRLLRAVRELDVGMDKVPVRRPPDYPEWGLQPKYPFVGLEVQAKEELCNLSINQLCCLDHTLQAIANSDARTRVISSVDQCLESAWFLAQSDDPDEINTGRYYTFSDAAIQASARYQAELRDMRRLTAFVESRSAGWSRPELHELVNAARRISHLEDA